MENLQSIKQTGVMKNNPGLAKSLLDLSQSPSSLDSLASSRNLLPFIEPSNLTGTNSDPLQSLLDGTIPSLNNLNNSASAASVTPNNIEASSLLTNPDTIAISLQPYLANALLSGPQNSTIYQII